MNKYIFVIDTDSYAGNFERDMCAYLTGIVGDCGVGGDFASLYLKETGQEESIFTDYIELRSDDGDCNRPCRCWPTKGWLSDGNMGAVKEEDWDQDKANENYRNSSRKIYQGYYDMYAKVDINNPDIIKAGYTKESFEKTLKRYQDDIDNCDTLVYPKTPPNNSVAIFFHEKPTPGMINLMKERAGKFAEAERSFGWNTDFQLTILGFRLLEEKTTTEEMEI